MATPVNKKLFTIVFFFSIFLVLNLIGTDLLAESDGSENQIIMYIIQIGFWIFGAALGNHFVQRLLRVSKDKDIDKATGGFIFDFVTILIYVVALAGIIGLVFEEAITSFWILVLGVALVIGLALRTELFRLFPTLSFDFNKPLQEGDWIKVNANVYTPEITGKIIDMNRKSIFVMSESNTVTIIPTKLLDDIIITNYRGPESKTKFSASFILDSTIPVERAKRILNAGVLQALEHQGFLKKKHPEVLIKRTVEAGIEYSVNYWINPWKSLTPAQANDIVTSTIMKHLAKADLGLAFPKEEVYYKELPSRHSEPGSLSDKKAILSNIEIFGLLDEDELDYLSSSVIQKVFVTGEEVITEGTTGDSMFILVEGLCDVFAVNEANERINVGQLSPGQFFGEMSLLTGEPRSATVVADTDSLIYTVTKDHFEEILKKRPGTAEEISNIVADRKFKTLQTIEMSEQHKETIALQILNGIRNFFGLDKVDHEKNDK